jgi:hypothetical protein
LESQHFNNNKDFMESVKTWLGSQAADFFETGAQELTPQHNKYLNNSGDYVQM